MDETNQPVKDFVHFRLSLMPAVSDAAVVKIHSKHKRGRPLNEIQRPCGHVLERLDELLVH